MLTAVSLLAAALLGGRLARRLGQPAALGELLAGTLAAAAAPSLGAHDPLLARLAEAGVALLLFETGLGTDVRELARVGRTSAAVALAGVAAPFALGWGAMQALGRGGTQALLAGAALTATSVGITARVLSDAGKLATEPARVVLGAAVIDDVLGVLLLCAVQGTGNLLSSAVVLGSFALGAALARRPAGSVAARAVSWPARALVPLFFAVTGARLSLRLDAATVALAAALLAAALAGKVVSGLAAPRHKLAVGVAMAPRGEVGLIFAQLGYASGALDAPLYTALVFVVGATTLLAPPLIARAFRTAD